MSIFASEYEMVDSLIDVAHGLGYRVCHFRPGRTARTKRVRDRQTGEYVEKPIWTTPIIGDPGFPDLVVCGHGLLLFIECKMPGKKPTADQQMWLDRLSLAGVETMVCYPKDYDALIRRLEEARNNGH